MMLRLIFALLMVGWAQSANAQPQSGKPVRQLLAGAKLPNVVDAPMHFKLLRVIVSASQPVNYQGPNSMIYAASGSLALTIDGNTEILQEGDAAFIAAGKNAVLKGGANRGAEILQFLLLPAADINKPPYAKGVVITELFQTNEPLPGLKPGPYEFTMTRVTAPPKMPAPPLHHRSGAALYHVFAGSGLVKTGDGKTEQRSRGAVQLEAVDFVHSWQNAGDTPLVLLQANISPEGTPEIIFIQ